jgi:transcriptional regulator with XRE-family HTH domain
MTKRVTFRFRQLRRELAAKEQRDVTLKEVSESTGIAISTLSRLESGGAQGVEIRTLERLAAFYKVGSGADLLLVEDARRTRQLAAAEKLSPTGGQGAELPA